MRISEIFYSIQGEGALTGVPSVFVRTSGCNLRCTWCDTPYASWNPEGADLSVAEVMEHVLEFQSRFVVITGGEPMIARGVHELAAALREAGLHITIETAGTVAPNGIPCDLASVSPKLANSTPKPDMIENAWIERHENLRLQPEVIRSWIEAGEYQLKFVVAELSDLEEIQSLIKTIGGDILPHRIQMMPEGTNADVLLRRQQQWVDVCKSHGYRLNHRLHVDLFGNTRGT